jgi:ABC-type lipoprotein export system ATPase subunit
MPEVLYEIRDLVCSYDQVHPVLKIASLDIYKGKQTVFIGKSGAGKSTILETLGLMNKTILDGEIIFTPDVSRRISLGGLWEDENEIADIRNRYYSFIFQDTNLMDNFSAFENACIPQLLQGASLETASKNIREAMHRVGMNNISEHNNVTQLSGGQRQRLAFVRAITPVFEVLFGDEPTGNLDEINSAELMRFIETDVHARHRSAILVSHDIDLSLKFADQIVVLLKDNDDQYGKVSDENIFMSEKTDEERTWFDLSGKKMNAIRNLLIERIM